MASEGSEPSATRLLAKIGACFSQLCEFPFSGVAREQFGAGLRVKFQGNYAIYDLSTQSEVIIVRVLHGARDAAALAGQGGFAR